MNNKVVIIGAGASGRGYIGRLLTIDGAQITFIDNNVGRVDALLNEGSYTIYIGRDRRPMQIANYAAFHSDSPEAAHAIAEADYVFVSVGEQNLPSLRGLFEERAKLGGVCKIIVCENGISPKTVLRNALSGMGGCAFKITQAVIFCTTIPSNGLDILSEDYGAMPYDTDEDLFEMPFRQFIPTKRFDVLFARKIYTYNCLSACIAYTGYLKGYTDYAAAANDCAINALCTQLSEQLTRVISHVYDIPEHIQEAFAKNAMRKFTNSAISDTIHKNARNASRKLAATERLYGPLMLFLQEKENIEILCLVMACALVYLSGEEKDSVLKEGCFRPIDLLLKINPDIPADAAALVLRYYRNLMLDGDIDAQIKRVLRR